MVDAIQATYCFSNGLLILLGKLLEGNLALIFLITLKVMNGLQDGIIEPAPSRKLSSLPGGSAHTLLLL
jgi:hypothetical protein